MKKFFGKKQDNLIILDGEELNHLAVLRCEQNEQVLCLTGDENEYLCKINSISKKQAECEIIQTNFCDKNPTKNITVYQGLPKMDKLEFITQKLTELGAKKLVPFESDFTIAKPNLNKIDRLNKISIEACKQCGRSIPLEIKNPIRFKDLLQELTSYDIVLFANETQKQITDIDFSSSKNIAIIIGSEGGFSPKEIKELSLKCMQFGLGSRILRTETASVLSTGLVSYLTKN